jgi:hypothetical protein
LAEQLFLSFWLRGFRGETMLGHFGRMLERFPFSTQSAGQRMLRIYAIEFVEPSLVDYPIPAEMSPDEIVETARPSMNDDCGCLLEGAWDLWQYEDEWKLRPSPVTLACFGPQFNNDWEDHLRLEAGFDSHFLPQPRFPDSEAKVQSNIRGLLRLAHELDGALPVDKRLLWSESGENFAERLQSTLA